MSNSEIKDKILEYSLSKGFDEHSSANEISKELFLDKSEEEIEHIFLEIQNDSNSIVEIILTDDASLIIPNIATKLFLEKGGYTELEKIEINKVKISIQKENLETELAISNIKANKLNRKIAKQNIKNEKQNQLATRINIVIGLINIGLLIWQTLKK
jgi:hypothetical protein